MADGDGVAGCRIDLHRVPSRPRIAGTDGTATAIPTLGEIVDKLRVEYPDRAWPCASSLRDVRISAVVIQDR